MAVLAQDLRDAVLQAAISGKLTEQLNTDSSVEELLSKIKAEKEQLIKEKKIKKEKELDSLIYDEDIMFEIPKSWKWVKLGELAVIQSSKRVFEKEYVTSGIPFFRSKEIGDLCRGGKIQTELFISKEHYENLKSKHGVPKIGDILITSVGTIGNTWVCDGREFYYKDGNITQICKNDYFNSFYIELFLRSQLFKKQAFTTVSGTVYSALTIVKLKNLVLPFPPIEEQARIVAKVEEIMQKIDEYEKIEKQLEEIKKAFPMDMRDALLQAAMQGKLTEQLDTDSSVDDLIEQIKAEREKLASEGKIKKSKGKKKGQQNDYFVELSKDEYPYEVPSNWRWTTLEEITIPNKGQGLTKSDIDTGDIPVILYGQLYTTYKNKITKVVSHASEKSIKKSFKVSYNDIILPLTSTSPKAEIGKGVIYSSNETAYLGSDILCLKHFINSEFLMLLINNPMFSRQKMNFVNGITIKHLNVNKFLTIPIAIPPIEEQQRIVETLDRLLPLCEAL